MHQQQNILQHKINTQWIGPILVSALHEFATYVLT